MNIRIQVTGVREVQARLGALGSKHLPIAMAATLSRLAARAQKEIRSVVLPKRFTLREPRWMKAGIRITPATRTKFAAVVEDINPWMEAQETTGRKLPFRGKYIAIPLRGARPTRRSKIRDENLPEAVMDAGGFIHKNIIFKVKRKGRSAGLATRRGQQGPQMPRTGNIMPMYYLAPRWTWRPPYGFRDSVTKTANDNFEGEFGKAFQQFVKSAK